jgi:hypothetical protein
MYESYKDQGLIVITLLVETLDRTAPTVDELNIWVDEYGVTHPVVSDAQWEVVDRYSERSRPALPSHTLIAPGMEILVASGRVEEADVVAALPGAAHTCSPLTQPATRRTGRGPARPRRGCTSPP